MGMVWNKISFKN